MNILRKSCRCTSVLSKLFKLEFSDEELKILDVVTTKHPSYKFLFRLTADLANPLITEPTREVSLPVLVLYDRYLCHSLSNTVTDLQPNGCSMKMTCLRKFPETNF